MKTKSLDQQQADRYADILHLAKQADWRGDVVMRKQYEASASEYWATRMSETARQIAREADDN